MILFRFHARDIHLVMGPRPRGPSVPFQYSSMVNLPTTHTASTPTNRAAAPPSNNGSIS